MEKDTNPLVSKKTQPRPPTFMSLGILWLFCFTFALQGFAGTDVVEEKPKKLIRRSKTVKTTSSLPSTPETKPLPPDLSSFPAPPPPDIHSIRINSASSVVGNQQNEKLTTKLRPSNTLKKLRRKSEELDEPASQTLNKKLQQSTQIKPTSADTFRLPSITEKSNLKQRKQLPESFREISEQLQEQNKRFSDNDTYRALSDGEKNQLARNVIAEFKRHEYEPKNPSKIEIAKEFLATAKKLIDEESEAAKTVEKLSQNSKFLKDNPTYNSFTKKEQIEIEMMAKRAHDLMETDSVDKIRKIELKKRSRVRNRTSTFSDSKNAMEDWK